MGQEFFYCNQALREQGKAYPRTCAVCGVGKCMRPEAAAIPSMFPSAAELNAAFLSLSGLNMGPGPFAGIPTDYGFEPQRSERNRLVWEAMKVYMVIDVNVLHRAVRIVDEYLEWRDAQ